MKKYLLFLTICLSLSGQIFACAAAHQNRLFPLGLCPKGLVVMEAHLFRTDIEVLKEGMPDSMENYDMDLAWGGKCYFNIYDNNYKLVHSELMDSIAITASPAFFDSILQATFMKGLALAQQLAGFIPAKPVSVSFCDYTRACSEASLLYNKKQDQLLVKLRNKTTRQIPFFEYPASIAKDLIHYFGMEPEENEDAGENKEEMDSLYQVFLTVQHWEGSLYINSVRHFTIGDRKLTMMHIGTGTTMESASGEKYPPGKEYKADFAFNDLRKSIYEEPALHHGMGFDFFVLE